MVVSENVFKCMNSILKALLMSIVFLQMSLTCVFLERQKGVSSFSVCSSSRKKSGANFLNSWNSVSVFLIFISKDYSLISHILTVFYYAQLEFCVLSLLAQGLYYVAWGFLLFCFGFSSNMWFFSTGIASSSNICLLC